MLHTPCMLGLVMEGFKLTGLQEWQRPLAAGAVVLHQVSFKFVFC